MMNAQLRNDRISTYAGTPRADIFVADTLDPIGVRFAHLPFTPDRIFARLPRA